MGIQTNTNTSGAVRAITPNDGTDLPLGVCRAIYVGVGGDISIDDLSGEAAGESVVFVGALAGSVIPVQTARVNATGTTATDLVALY
jgi:hypothetical protein